MLFFCGHIPNCPGSIFRAISLYTDLLFTTFIPTQSPWAGHLRTAALHCGLSKIEFGNLDSGKKDCLDVDMRG